MRAGYATRLSRIAPYAFMAPAVMIMVGALLWPLAHSVWLSFHEWKLGTPQDAAVFTGLENYRILLADPDTLTMRIYKTAFEFQQLGRASALSNLLLLLVAAISVGLVLFNKLRERANASG